MSKIRHADFYPDEFLVGIVGLNPAEIGAYWVACSLMYSRGGPIADDDAWIARACGCHVRTWRMLKTKLVAAGKLRIEGGVVVNSRVVREIERAHGRVKQSRRAAEASAKARRQAAEDDDVTSDDNDLAEAPVEIPEEPTNQLPTNQLPTNQLPTNQLDTGRARERDAFDAFVEAAKRNPRWPAPVGLSATRRKALRARLVDSAGIDGFREVVSKAEASDFICREMTGWGLDWFLKAANFAKVSEGNYDNDRRTAAARAPMPSRPTWAEGQP